MSEFSKASQQMEPELEFLGNREKLVLDAVADFLRTSSQAFFAVAYGTYGAIRRLDEAYPLADFLGRGCHLRAIFDIDRHFTDPDLIDELCTIPGDVECRLYAPRIRGTDHSDSLPALHAKVYYFESGDTASVVIGSSNFSETGLCVNFEGCVCLKASRDHALLESLRTYLEALWCSPFCIDVAEYAKFRDGYAEAYRRARQRQIRPGVAAELPLHQTQEDVEVLQSVLEAARIESVQPVTAYVLGLTAGGGHSADSEQRTLTVRLRRGLLNRNTRREGRIYFADVSERDLSQQDCVRRDAERIVSRLQNSFREVGTADTAGLEKRGDLIYHLNLTFSESSPIWETLGPNLEKSSDGKGRYMWPDELALDDPEIRRAFLQGYMDIRTRITATDALPGSTRLMRVAVSVGAKAPEFAERFRNLLAAEFDCRPEEINLLSGTRRRRETLIRTDARLIPPNFVQSPWQRIVIEDFRRFNEGIAT